ncbi:hypothetical protein NECAME_03243 [Necator americanus]|uniref:Programmed cell death protein 10 dimerisation domain-containing protein n=1 Tax=Necator americanus TaxID=51031 RepID=W2T5F4_NECAM|nr:hypothetical protein NECAME_03243 [Necator americanus]ETN77143.1 hypothetical protein NECAME_03243 [Necator americanus]
MIVKDPLDLVEGIITHRHTCQWRMGHVNMAAVVERERQTGSGGRNGYTNAVHVSTHHDRVPSPRRRVAGALEYSLLPALEGMSRTRHATAELEALANAFRHAEEVCPGICNELVEEILTRLAHPQVNQSDLGRAVQRLTTRQS